MRNCSRQLDDQSGPAISHRGLLFGLGSSLLYIPAVTVPSFWFKRKRGLALGIGISASGIGGITFAPLTQYLLLNIGLAWSLRVLGMITCACSVLAILLVDLPKSHQTGPTDSSRWKMLKPYLQSKVFWLFALAVFLINLGYFIPPFLIPSYSVHVGLSAMDGAAFIAVINATSIVSRIVLGGLADRFSRFLLLCITVTICAISCLTLWFFAHSYAMMMAFSIIFGLMGGGYVSLLPAACTDIFEPRVLSSMTGLVFVFDGFRSLLGTPISLLLRPSHHGSYMLAIVYTGVCMLLGSIILGIVAYVHKRRPLIEEEICASVDIVYFD